MKICPLCKGKGKLPDKSDMIARNKRIVKMLHKEGMKWKDIMNLLGYKSPRSIHQLLK